MNGKDSWKDPEELLQHAGWIRHLAFATLGDAQLAEDVSQEVLVKALAGPQRRGRVLRSWLGMVTKNSALNKIRSRNRSLAREAKVARPEAEDDSRNREVLFAYQEVMSAIDSIASQHREILMLHFHQNQSLKEIAHQLGMKEGSVRVRLHRALEALRGKLNRDENSWEVNCLALLPLGILVVPWGTAKWALPSFTIGAVAACLAFIVGVFAWMQPSVGKLDLPSTPTAAMDPTAGGPALAAESLVAVVPSVQRTELSEKEKEPPVQGRHAWKEMHGRVLLLGEGVAEAEVQLWQNGELSRTLTLNDGKFSIQVDDLLPVDLTVVSGEMMTSLEVPSHNRSPVLIHLTPEEEHTELVPILVHYRLGGKPVSRAKIKVYLDRSNGSRIPALRKGALELMAEGRTDEHGNFFAPAWLKDIRLAASVEAPGLLPVLAPLERQDYGYIYLDMDAVKGKARPVQLVYEDGSPASKLKVNVGFYGEQALSTDADGFLPEIPSWSYCKSNEELGPLPDAVLAHLPDGRLWSFVADKATQGWVKTSPKLIQITLNRTPLQVRLRCDTLPEGTWVEARIWKPEYRSLSDGVENRIWQRLEPGEYIPMEQSWLGASDRLETRLMPSGILLKENALDMEDDRFDVKLTIGELFLTLAGPSLEAGLPVAAVHRWWKTKVQTSALFVDGAATFYYAFEEGKPFSVSLVNTQTGQPLLREKEDGSVTLAGARAVRRVESIHVVESTHRYQPILIRMDGEPVIGGKVGGIGGKWSIALDGTVIIPMEADAAPALNYANLFLPAGMHQSPGGPITSAFNLDPWGTPPGVFHRNPDGGWFWDLELAQVEILVPADSTSERRNITESVGRLVMFFSYPYHLDFDDQRGAHAGPDGGWIPFRVPAGTYAFHVGKYSYGGSKGVAVEAGKLNRLEPDTAIMPASMGD